MVLTALYIMRVLHETTTGQNMKFPCPGNVQYRAEFPVL